MARRQFLGTVGAGLTLGRTAAQAPGLVLPAARQVRWQDFELGVLYHLDSHIYAEDGFEFESGAREAVDPALYNPVDLDTDQWLEAAVAMGARYAIFTATHMNGFIQWQSDAYPYGVKHVAWRDGKGDIVADFVESCRRVGVAPGIYIGIRFNAHKGVYGYKLNGGRGGTPEEQQAYMRTCEQMVREVCTRYGELAEIWFDGGVPSAADGGPDVAPIVQEHQPGAVFYHSPDLAEHRWAGTESGTTGYPCWSTMRGYAWQHVAHGTPEGRETLANGHADGDVWSPAMADAPLRNHHWCWKPDTEQTLRSVDELMAMHAASVGRNANLILGAVVNRDGLVEEPDMRRCREFGRALRRRFGSPIAEASGRGRTVELSLPRAGTVDQVSIMEDLTRGERIRRYVVEGRTAGGAWEALCEGESVGHRRIQRFEAREVARMRLRCTESVAQPVVRALTAYEAAE